jgi:tetratricopeptide (TPR) repeat protein
VDAATAELLRAEAQAARAALRRGDPTAVQALEDRYAETRQALDWYAAAGRTDEAFRLAAALVPFWMATKRVDEGIDWFEGALAQAGAPSPERAEALHDQGYLAFFAGRYDLADRRFAESRALAEAIGDRSLIARALAGTARVALNSDPAAAVQMLREAMALTSDLPGSAGRSSAEHVLGVALQLSGDLEGAREVMQERLDRSRAEGNEFVVAMETANLSMVERQLGNLDRAEALSLDAMRFASTRQDEMAIPWTINGLAAVTAAQGRHERAATLLGLAEALIARAGGEWPADERAQHHGTLVTLSAALSAAALDEARARAAGMSLAEAVAYALAESGSRGET